MRFQHAFTSWHYIFTIIPLVSESQCSNVENATIFSKCKLKQHVVTWLKQGFSLIMMKNNFFPIQYYKQTEAYKVTLHYLNTTLTGLFTLECVMKIFSFGFRVNKFRIEL